MVSRWSSVSCSAGKTETQENQGAKELEAIPRRSRWSRVSCSAGMIETQGSLGAKELEAIRQEVQVVKSLLLSR
jgi:hypothetical protein